MLMKTALRLFGLLLSLAISGAARQAETAAPPPGLPPADGVYCQLDSVRWVKLETAPLGEAKIENKDVFLETAGLIALNMTFTYSGSQASLRISDPRPRFYVRGVGSAADAVIVRLSRKKDRRTVEATSAAAGIGNKAGFRRQHVRPVATVQMADGLFSVRPEESLEPGEYLLVFDSPNTAYDFGISQPKR